MKKNTYLLGFLFITALFLSSCAGIKTAKESFRHFSNMEKVNIDSHPKNSEKISDMKFNISNNPDYTIKVSSINLNNQYISLLNFLKKEDFLIQYKQITKNVSSQIIAIPPYKIKNGYYLGIELSLNFVNQKTIYNIVYGNDINKAKAFFDKYKKYNKNIII